MCEVGSADSDEKKEQSELFFGAGCRAISVSAAQGMLGK